MHRIKVWGDFKSALQLTEAQHILTKLLQWQEKEWITEELQNLSRKKREAWQRLQQDSNGHPNSALQNLHRHYCKQRLQRLQQNEPGTSGGVIEQLKQRSVLKLQRKRVTVDYCMINEL